VTEAGLLVSVNVETLIEAIYISPRAPAVVERTVLDLLLRLWLPSIPVRPSRLTAKPIY
jgi:hypothetical protein